MKSEPLVSIVCLAYQHKAFIGQALDGFMMQQTSFPFEVIIHDDASTDGTAEVIQEYARRHPGVIKPILQRINQYSKGGGRVTRIAFGEARGKYIAYCEADDYWTDPLKLQKQVDLLESDFTLSGCFHHVQQIFQGTEKLGRIYGDNGPQRRFQLDDTISKLALFHPASFLFRKSALEIPAWYSHIKSGDMALFTLVSGKGDLACIPEVMAVYRKHEGGITTTNAHTGQGFSVHRINLWLYVDRHFHYRHHAKCREVILYHWQQLCMVCTPWTRLRHLAWLGREHPAWFLHHPRFSASMLHDALRR